MEQRHTPGPWKVLVGQKEAVLKYAPVFVIRAGDKEIAKFSWNDQSLWFPTQAEAEANARLIAAAPDLLDFAKAVAAAGHSGADTVNFLVKLRDLAIRASKLVARATGGQP